MPQQQTKANVKKSPPPIPGAHQAKVRQRTCQGYDIAVDLWGYLDHFIDLIYS